MNRRVPLFRKKLQAIKEKKPEWSDKKIAAIMGVEPPTVWRYQKGYKNESGEIVWPEPKFEEFMRLATAAGQPLGWWAMVEGEPDLALFEPEIPEEVAVKKKDFETLIAKTQDLQRALQSARGNSRLRNPSKRRRERL